MGRIAELTVGDLTSCPTVLGRGVEQECRRLLRLHRLAPRPRRKASRISSAKWTITCARHLAAGFCAVAAGSRALLAMVHLVLRALHAASVASFGAKLADALGKLRATGHFAHRERADIGAAPVELDAAGHHLDVFLVQARGGTVFTGVHALMTRLNAVFVFFVGHVVLFWFMWPDERSSA